MSLKSDIVGSSEVGSEVEPTSELIQRALTALFYDDCESKSLTIRSRDIIDQAISTNHPDAFVLKARLRELLDESSLNFYLEAESRGSTCPFLPYLIGQVYHVKVNSPSMAITYYSKAIGAGYSLAYIGLSESYKSMKRSLLTTRERNHIVLECLLEAEREGVVDAVVNYHIGNTLSELSGQLRHGVTVDLALEYLDRSAAMGYIYGYLRPRLHLVDHHNRLGKLLEAEKDGVKDPRVYIKICETLEKIVYFSFTDDDRRQLSGYLKKWFLYSNKLINMNEPMGYVLKGKIYEKFTWFKERGPDEDGILLDYNDRRSEALGLWLKADRLGLADSYMYSQLLEALLHRRIPNAPPTQAIQIADRWQRVVTSMTDRLTLSTHITTMHTRFLPEDLRDPERLKAGRTIASQVINALMLSNKRH